VTVSNACISVTDEIEITTINCHLDFNIPNVFTPNGDGINDTFAPEFTPPENVRSFQMSMYDRWGRLVFSTGSYQMSWDGNNKNGKPYAEGVYYCVLYFTDILGQEYTHHSSVTLIR
jgi:gliding motility-associated-like protein